MRATLRYRGDKNNLIELAKNLDAFKKVPEKYTETTEIGGTLSLISRLLIIYLIYKEVRYYQDANLIYEFEPDVDMDDKVDMHVDITVAMPCKSLSGLDVMDETEQDVFAYGTLQRESTWWTMPTEERLNFERMRHMNSFLREQYHSVADILFKDLIKSEPYVEKRIMDFRSLTDDEYDACRLHGTLVINKVAGILHLTAQPVIDVIDHHFIIGLRMGPSNFSHRINRLSFGQYSRRIVQPLEGDETITTDEFTKVQYFLKIVPTEVHNTFSTINTYQYAVTENIRKLDHQISAGTPGIYFKYDWSALKIIVRTDRDNFVQFIIRLCSIIAGIVVISGLLNSFCLAIQRNVISHLAPQLYFKTTTPNISSDKINTPILLAPTAVTPPSTPLITTNDLINTANRMSEFMPHQNSLETTIPTIQTDMKSTQPNNYL